MRSFWSFGRGVGDGLKGNLFSSNNLGTIEKAAEEEPENPRKQAALYRVLIENDELETVIRRFEDKSFARDTECMIHYLCALYSTSQLERAAKFILNNNNNNTQGSSESMTSGFVIGTKDRPLHVINDSSSSSGSWGKRFTTVVNVAIVAAILYSIFSMNESKLGGMQSNLLL